jgi:hypothetical protein
MKKKLRTLLSTGIHLFIGKCSNSTLLQIKKEEGTLSFSGKIKLYWHLFFCKYCSRFAKQTTSIINTLKNRPVNTEDKMRKDKKEAIKALLKD